MPAPKDLMSRLESGYVVAIETWAGRRTHGVEIVGETKTRFRVKARDTMILPGKRFVCAGAIVLVPKHAVQKGDATEIAAYQGHIYGYCRCTPDYMDNGRLIWGTGGEATTFSTGLSSGEAGK